MSLIELRERLQKATGPDRELDGELAILAGGIRTKTRALSADLSPPPSYTASIDAAVSLVPEGAWKEVNGPRRYLHIPSPSPNYWHCAVSIWEPMRDFHGWGATEPLAICAACIEYELAKAETKASQP